MNGELVKHYMGITLSNESTNAFEKLVQNPNQMASNIMGSLNYLTNHNWTYEIESESYLDDGTTYHVTVIIYIPGRIMTGNGVNNTDVGRNFKLAAVNKAIRDAVTKMFSIGPDTLSDQDGKQWVMHQEVKTNADYKAPAPSTQTTPAFTAPANNYTPPVNNPVPQTPPQPIQQQPQSTTYTPEQIAGMAKFKQDFNIQNDEQFMAHIRTWNANITSKTQMTPENVDKFLVYVKTLESGGF